MLLKFPRITRLALLSLFIFSALGLYFADVARPQSVMEFLKGFAPFWQQLLWGMGIGLLASMLAWWWIRRPFMVEVHAKYVRLFSSFHLRTTDIVIISFSAGVGEELFFRGAVQPYLGVVWTAVVFVALHGYLNPKDWKMTSYGLLMTAIIVALGYMTEYIGIVSAMLAHVVIDLVLLYRLREADVGKIS